MTMDRLSQLPNRNVLTYRSGSCILASKVIKKYKKQNLSIAKDSTQQLVWLAYLKFLDTFGKELREHVVNNRINAISQTDLKFVYKSKMRKYLG